MRKIVRPIEMISITTREGKIRPVKFKILGEDDQDHVVHVSKINKMEESNIAGIRTRIYIGEVQVGDVARLCEIRYGIDNTKWELYKI